MDEYLNILVYSNCDNWLVSFCLITKCTRILVQWPPFHLCVGFNCMYQKNFDRLICNECMNKSVIKFFQLTLSFFFWLRCKVEISVYVISYIMHKCVLAVLEISHIEKNKQKIFPLFSFPLSSLTFAHENLNNRRVVVVVDEWFNNLNLCTFSCFISRVKWGLSCQN